jgi:hypothetical protein
MYQRNFLIARLNKARARLNELIAKAPTDREIYPGWKLKEFVGHVSGWDDATIQGLQVHAAGTPVPRTVTQGIDGYNAYAVAQRAALGLPQVLKEMDEKRAALIQVLHELPDDRFNVPLDFPWGDAGTVAYMIEIFVDHEEELAEDLHTWLKSPDQPLPAKH